MGGTARACDAADRLKVVVVVVVGSWERIEELGERDMKTGERPGLVRAKVLDSPSCRTAQDDEWAPPRMDCLPKACCYGAWGVLLAPKKHPIGSSPLPPLAPLKDLDALTVSRATTC